MKGLIFSSRHHSSSPFGPPPVSTLTISLLCPLALLGVRVSLSSALLRSVSGMLMTEGRTRADRDGWMA